jgi:hypothetical protein
VAFDLAGRSLRRWFRGEDDALQPWLFPQLLAITQQWMAECVSTAGTYPGYLLWSEQGDADWEAAAAQALEEMPEVLRYVRNEKPGFEMPCVDGLEERRYRPDFIAVVDDGHWFGGPLLLVLGVRGRRDARDNARHDTMRTLWVPAVNALGRFGRWDFLVVDGSYEVVDKIRAAI